MQNHDRNVFHTVPHDADVGVWVRLVNGETLYQVKTSLVIGGTRTWIHDLIKLTLNLKNCFFIKTFDIYCFNVFCSKIEDVSVYVSKIKTINNSHYSYILL